MSDRVHSGTCGALVRLQLRSVFIAGVALAWSSSASAFCRTTTCDRQGAPAECTASQTNYCSAAGTPIAWPDTCVSSSVSIQGSVRRGITADTMRAIVSQAFQQWTNVSCRSGGHPNFVVDTFPDVACTVEEGVVGYNDAGPNQNAWVFYDDTWPFQASGGDGAVAITSVIFDVNTGEIYDADVELNSRDNFFTTGDQNVDVDLASVVQHEAGHFLGLAHSTDPEATMFPNLADNKSEKTKLRTLEQDDVDGVCAVYPPGTPNRKCDPEPRHGFSSTCSLPTRGCAVSRSRFGRRPHSGHGFAGFAGILCALGVGRFRRRSNSLR